MSRTAFLKLALGLLFAVLAAGMFNLQLLGGAKYRDLSNRNSIRLIPQKGCRGLILDCEGNRIAGSRLSYDVSVLPQGVKDRDGIFSALSRVLGTDAGAIAKKFKNGYTVPSVPVLIARNIELKKAIALEERKSELPGVIVQPSPLRDYPHGRLASHVLGYIGEIDRWRLTRLTDYGYKTKDLVGFGGVEERLDYYLREEEGGLSMEVDHRGRSVRILGLRPPVNGKDVKLTLNLKIQKIVEESLKDKTGCAILMSPLTGEVIAMASVPDYSPAVFTERQNQEIARLVRDLDAPLVNRAISGVYPAGSVFKVIVAAAGLETKKISAHTTFVCTGSTMVGSGRFNCWSTHGRQDLRQAITHSCNVYFYRSGLLAGPEAIHDYALQFGLGHTCGFELPNEAAGSVPSPFWRKVNRFKSWYDGDTANLSIGQGDLLVTPLQITRAMAVFANGGFLVTPYIIKEIDGKDVSASQQKSVRLNLKDSNLESIRQGLKGVVAEAAGTASILSELPVQVAGKTGTAQAPPGAPHGWFTGFFPYKKPKYVICVFLERGGAGYYASQVAKQIIARMAAEGLIN
ncbi:MAG: penicillin-binding protein 2 [Candidatus Omnitrophica bacterium]|nr:penicillin-binding protein 2 [Candidatus Omnitrophota bacterium]